MVQPIPQRYLRRADAAHYVREEYGFPCSTNWLAKLAVVGGGPVFRKAGRFPIYHPADLDVWAKSRIGEPRLSTSDDGFNQTTSEYTEVNDGR